MKCKHCGGEMPPPTGKGRPRVFCTPECGRAFWKNKAKRPDPTPRHSITGVDEVARTGVCALCGPVKVYRWQDKYEDGRERIRWVCQVRHAASAAKSRPAYDRSERGKSVRQRIARRSRYGLTHAELEAVEALNTGHCQICGKESDALVFDHCHTGGGFRGWLCHDCNLGLGKFGDDPDRLDAAAAYLRSYITKERQMAN